MENRNSNGSNIQKKSWISNFIIAFSEWSLRWVPDSMVFVLGLTVVIYVMAWLLTPHGPVDLVNDWVKGFWVLLTFLKVHRQVPRRIVLLAHRHLLHWHEWLGVLQSVEMRGIVF